MLNYLYKPEVSHIVLLGKVYFSFLFWGFCRLEAFSAALVRDLTKRKNHTCFARITITCVIPGAPLALWDILTPSRFLSSRNGTVYGTYGTWDTNLWQRNICATYRGIKLQLKNYFWYPGGINFKSRNYFWYPDGINFNSRNFFWYPTAPISILTIWKGFSTAA